MRRRASVDDRCRGAITAEFAVLLPAVVMFLAAVLAAGSAAVAQVRCLDAARSAARLAARHEPAAVVLSTARTAAPAGAAVRVGRVGRMVRVEVIAQVALPLPGRPVARVGAAASAWLEDVAAAGRS